MRAGWAIPEGAIRSRSKARTRSKPAWMKLAPNLSRGGSGSCRKDNATVEKEVDLIAVGGAGRNAAEDADAAVGAAAFGPVELLIDDTVDAAVAAELAGDAVTQRGRQREPITIKSQIVEFSEMMPAAQPVDPASPRKSLS